MTEDQKPGLARIASPAPPPQSVATGYTLATDDGSRGPVDKRERSGRWPPRPYEITQDMGPFRFEFDSGFFQRRQRGNTRLSLISGPPGGQCDFNEIMSVIADQLDVGSIDIKLDDDLKHFARYGRAGRMTRLDCENGSPIAHFEWEHSINSYFSGMHGNGGKKATIVFSRSAETLRINLAPPMSPPEIMGTSSYIISGQGPTNPPEPVK